jgi:hypothetical protein
MRDLDALESFCLVGGIQVIIVSGQMSFRLDTANH